jgi:hypothetical protein
MATTEVSCKHLPMCKCIKQATDPCPEISTWKGRPLVGGPIPKCHEDIRDFIQQQKDEEDRQAA